MNESGRMVLFAGAGPTTRLPSSSMNESGYVFGMADDDHLKKVVEEALTDVLRRRPHDDGSDFTEAETAELSARIKPALEATSNGPRPPAED